MIHRVTMTDVPTQMNPASVPCRATAFGLIFESVLPLPELLAAPADRPADVQIVYGAVPAELPGTLKRGVRFQSAPGALRLQVDGVATFLVEEGRRITVARAEGAEDDDVRVFLLGSAVGALLHQRGDLVLHGSAVAHRTGAAVFLGRSGAGKSTLATAFRQRGCAMLTDDLCIVRPGPDGRMLAFPGFPQTKLWLDSLKKLELAPEGLRRIRHKLEKRALPLAEAFAGQPVPVHRLYVLRSHNREEMRLTPVQGPGKFSLLKLHTFRFGFMADIDSKAGHFQHALKLGQQVPLAVVIRPSGSFQLAALVDLIEADLQR